MSDRPIERLNYFNGQRLEAEDFQLEQDYHVQVQRWLMKTLFVPGVAKGFEVFPVDGGNRIRLEPGLALDDLGRAIILVAPVELVPQARFLCIRYAERKERVQEGSCAVSSNGHGMTAKWGGPERILSQPDIFWRADPPLYDTRELIIAELKLRANCTVEKILDGPRRFAVPSPIQKVRQLSFEGEKDIDKNNAKVISFFIRGRRPNEVTLHLQARRFSTLHYTEMGEVTPKLTGHGPNNEIETDAPSGVDGHSHDGSSLTATVNPTHNHDVKVRTFDPSADFTGNQPSKGIFLATSGLEHTAPPFAVGGITGAVSLAAANIDFSVIDGSHGHGITGNTAATVQDEDPKHKHIVPINVSTTGSAGNWTVRGGSQLAFLSDLRITVGKAGGGSTDVTAKVLDYVKRNYASVWSNETIFDGNTGSPLHDFGTGPIRLDLIDGLSFDPDDFMPYEIKLEVTGSGNGGCIKYNLYVD